METAAPWLPGGPRGREARRHALLAVIGEVGTEPERGALRGALERGEERGRAPPPPPEGPGVVCGREAAGALLLPQAGVPAGVRAVIGWAACPFSFFPSANSSACVSQMPSALFANVRSLKAFRGSGISTSVEER